MSQKFNLLKSQYNVVALKLSHKHYFIQLHFLYDLNTLFCQVYKCVNCENDPRSVVKIYI